MPTPPAPGPTRLPGDKAYPSRGNRAYLRERHIKAVIAEKRDQAANQKEKGGPGGLPASHDADRSDADQG